jgi:hypothetical protein
MRDPERYRAEAEFWAEMAEEMRRPDYRARWLHLAQQRRELADQLANNPARGSSKPWLQ